MAVLAALVTGGTGAPLWEKPSLFLGSLDLDGGLRQRFELGVLGGSPEFALPVFLEHGFRGEEPVSEYRIPQLETYVVPEGREQILWLEPGGIRHYFKSSEVRDKAPERQKEPWIATRAGAGNHEFRSNDGWIYRYESGGIRSLTAPTGRTLCFETRGLRVRRIYQESGGREINLLEAKENDAGQTTSLHIGPDVHEFRYSPDSERLVSWHSPRMGKDSVTFAYSGKGLVETVALPGGKKLTYAWGGSDGAWQKDSGFELPPKEDRAYLIADSDHKFEYGINRSGINLLRADRLGLREGFAFNPKTQQLVRRNRDGGESTEFYGLRGPSQNRLESARDARGRETVRLTYDEQGRLKSKQLPGMAEFRFEYDALDRIAKVFRLDQPVKSYEYLGDSDKPVKITNALGDTIEISYTPAGQVAQYKNLDGAVFGFSYDDLGQLTEERLPMGYKRTTERDAFGRVTRVTDVDGKETRYEYTAENRLATVHDGLGTTWKYEYDPDGALARLLRDGNTWQKTERQQVAETGETVVRETNPSGDETVFRFDKDGNLAKQVDALGNETKYKHDAIGQLTGWEDARGVTADFERDALGRVAGVDTGAGAGLQMAYDLTGRIRRKNNGEQDIRFDYDKAGRLVKIDYGKGQTIDYTYDFCGRVITALTGQGVKTTYTWDALDRKTSERNDIPGGVFTFVKWTYTPSGKTRTVAVHKNGEDQSARLQETGYEYDDLGRYTRIFVNGVPKVWYEYDEKSLQLRQKRFFNGWVVKYEHHPDGHPKSIVATDDKGKIIKDVSYVWSPQGKLQQRVLDGVLHEYRYDPLGRLIDVIKSKLNYNTVTH